VDGFVVGVEEGGLVMGRGWKEGLEIDEGCVDLLPSSSGSGSVLTSLAFNNSI